MTNFGPLVGRWTLVAAAQINVEPLTDRTVPEGRAWTAPLAPAAGLVLTVRPDRRFEERAVTNAGPAPAAEFFDAEGVATLPPEPFDGWLEAGGGGRWFLFAAGHDRPDPGGMARYDDGDTVVVDRFDRVDGRLFRQQTVVTDGAYETRCAFVYERSA